MTVPTVSDEICLELPQFATGMNEQERIGYFGCSNGLEPLEQILKKYTTIENLRLAYHGSLTVFPISQNQVGIAVTFIETEQVLGRIFPFVHGYVLTHEQYQKIHCNPFVLVRHGSFQVTSTRPQNLPEAALVVEEISDEQAWEVAVDRLNVPPPHFRKLLDSAMAEERTYIRPLGDTMTLAELVLLALPLQDRLTFSFTTCLMSRAEKCTQDLKKNGSVRWCIVPDDDGIFNVKEEEHWLDLGSGEFDGIQATVFSATVEEAIQEFGSPNKLINLIDECLAEISAESAATIALDFLRHIEQATEGTVSQADFTQAVRRILLRSSQSLHGLAVPVLQAVGDRLLTCDLNMDEKFELTDLLVPVAASAHAGYKLKSSQELQNICLQLLGKWPHSFAPVLEKILRADAAGFLVNDFVAARLLPLRMKVLVDQFADSGGNIPSWAVKESAFWVGHFDAHLAGLPVFPQFAQVCAQCAAMSNAPPIRVVAALLTTYEDSLPEEPTLEARISVLAAWLDLEVQPALQEPHLARALSRFLVEDESVQTWRKPILKLIGLASTSVDAPLQIAMSAMVEQARLDSSLERQAAARLAEFLFPALTKDFDQPFRSQLLATAVVRHLESQKKKSGKQRFMLLLEALCEVGGTTACIPLVRWIGLVYEAERGGSTEGAGKLAPCLAEAFVVCLLGVRLWTANEYAAMQAALSGNARQALLVIQEPRRFLNSFLGKAAAETNKPSTYASWLNFMHGQYGNLQALADSWEKWMVDKEDAASEFAISFEFRSVLLQALLDGSQCNGLSPVGFDRLKESHESVLKAYRNAQLRDGRIFELAEAVNKHTQNSDQRMQLRIRTLLAAYGNWQSVEDVQNNIEYWRRVECSGIPGNVNSVVVSFPEYVKPEFLQEFEAFLRLDRTYGREDRSWQVSWLDDVSYDLAGHLMRRANFPAGRTLKYENLVRAMRGNVSTRAMFDWRWAPVLQPIIYSSLWVFRLVFPVLIAGASMGAAVAWPVALYDGFGPVTEWLDRIFRFAPLVNQASLWFVLGSFILEILALLVFIGFCYVVPPFLFNKLWESHHPPSFPNISVFESRRLLLARTLLQELRSQKRN